MYLHKGELDQVISIYPTVRHHRVYSDSTAPLSHHTKPHVPRLIPKREADTIRAGQGEHHTQQGAHVAQITAASSPHGTPQHTIFLHRCVNVYWTCSQTTLVMRTAAHRLRASLYKYYEDTRPRDGSPTNPVPRLLKSSSERDGTKKQKEIRNNYSRCHSPGSLSPGHSSLPPPSPPSLSTTTSTMINPQIKIKPRQRGLVSSPGETVRRKTFTYKHHKYQRLHRHHRNRHQRHQLTTQKAP